MDRRPTAPRARLLVEASLLADDARLLWAVPVAGLPLLTRQILCLRNVGISQIELVAEPANHEALRRALARLRPTIHDVAVAGSTELTDGPQPSVLNLPVNLVIDPRALRQLIQTSHERNQSVICVDRFAANYPASAKSPHVVGVPGGGDGQIADASEVSLGTLMPIGVALQRESSPLFLDIGRYTWHLIRDAGGAAEATAKILFSTFKPTDGVYAKTNRRVSTRISRVLLPTSVTPNQVTVFGLLCCGFAGAVMAGGTYLSLVMGGFLMWFASMIDGVDGELARAKFQATALGQKLEMASDYVFYLAVVSGYGVGLHRADGSRVWLEMAIAGLVGVLVSLLVLARDRRMYARWEPEGGDYYLAFQRRTGAQTSNPFYRFTRLCNFLVHRAAFPYFIMIFNILGLPKLMFVMVVVGTHLSWILTLYAGRLKPIQAVAAVRPDSDRSAPLVVARPQPARVEPRRDVRRDRESGDVIRGSR